MNIKLSVIVTVFNQEKYISQCIESVLKQNLREVEIIIIDDGSTDKSSEIVNEYAQDNSSIRYYKQDNKGVSSARNKGLDLANGEYVTFLDGDDTVPFNGYLQLYAKASQNYADTAIGNILCFDENKKWNLKYMKKVLNNKLPQIRHITKHKELILSPSVCNKIFRRNLLLENKINFDETLSIGEDLLFTIKSLHTSNKTVVLNETVLNYRVLKNSNSLTKVQDIDYFNSLVLLQQKINRLYIDLNIESGKREIETRQLKFFIDSIFKRSELFNEKEKVLTLIQISQRFLSTISDKSLIGNFRELDRLLLSIIINEKCKDFVKLMKIIRKEYNPIKIMYKDNKFYSYLYNYFSDYAEVLELTPRTIHNIEVFRLDGSQLKIGGYAFLEGISSNSVKKSLVFRNKNEEEKIIDLDDKLRTDISYISANNKIDYDLAGFETINIDLLKLLRNEQWRVFIRLTYKEHSFDTPLLIKLARLRNNAKPVMFEFQGIFPSYSNEQFCVEIKNINKIDYFKNRIIQLKKDFRYDLSFLKSKEYSTFFAILLYKLTGWFFRKRKIWIIGERKDTAQDNSFHFFKYVRQNFPEINIYYVIDKSSEDYKNLVGLGNVIDFNSFKHTFYLLVCDKSINSYYEVPNMYTESYNKILKYYPKWQQNKKIFLQHGVIGVSRVNHVLNKNRIDYSKFMVSSNFERNHIIKEFGFNENEVVVTGLARWDKLKDVSKGNEILLMPTWRNWIKSTKELVESNYWNQYINFLHSEELHSILEKRDLNLTFYPHYQTQLLLENMPMFHKRIKVVKQGEESVQSLLKRHALLITDYSTVSFDFVYMEKPVIFYQFDYAEFYSKHYNEGPINHETDLFGSIVKRQDQLIERIDQYSYKNMQIEPIYLQKSNKFITRDYENHCKRTLKRIIEMESEYELINDRLR